MLDKSQRHFIKDSDNTDVSEIARFDRLAQAWWDPNGAYKNVLAFNYHRWQIILAEVVKHFHLSSDDPDLSDLTVLDIGCGGGLLCEPFALKKANVTGIDASQMSIEVAKRHASQQGLIIDYRHCLSEDLVGRSQRFDIVLNTEVIEHVPNQQELIAQCCQLLKPGGLLVLATLNRTLKSYFVGIVGAEYVLRMLPIGTHDWCKFVKPNELQQWLLPHQLKPLSSIGMAFNPITGKWRTTSDLSVNYILFASENIR